MSTPENLSALRLQGEEIHLWQAGQEAMRLDDDALSSMNSVPLAVPAERVRLKVLDVPADERRHLGQSLPFVMEEDVVDPIESLHFAFSPTEDDNYVAAVASREDMELWLERLGPDFEGPFVHEALLLPWQPGEICLLVEESSVLVRIDRWQGFRIEHGLLAPLLDALPTIPERVVVYGQQQVDDLALLPQSMAAIAQWRQGGFGAALMLAESSDLTFDLRQGQYAPRLPLARWWRASRILVSALLIGLMVQFASDVWLYLQLGRENESLRAAIQDSYRSANPRGAIVDAEKQLDRQIAEYAGGGSGVAFTPFLASVTKVIAEQGEIAISSMNFSASAGEMRLDLMAPDYDAVESLREQLARANLKTTLETSSQRDDRVRARLRIEA